MAKPTKRPIPAIPPKGSPVRDLADWKSGDRRNPPQSIKDYVEQSQQIRMPDLPDALKED